MQKGAAPTVGAAIQQAAARLAIAPGLASTYAQSGQARRDAELLLRHVTGLTRTVLLTHPERLINNTELQAYADAIERRALSEPLQYITGSQEFYGLELKVTPDVLIPRPETEHLVQMALDIARGWPGQQNDPGSLRILDIGTGSGAIAIALSANLPQAALVATDISERALAVASENAARHGVKDRVSFMLCDLLPEGAGSFDIICSNPPYIANGEVLETQVAAFEPHLALFAGADGLEVYRRLVPAAFGALKPGGSLLLEIGMGQLHTVQAILAASHLTRVFSIDDLQGIPRVVVVTKL